MSELLSKEQLERARCDYERWGNARAAKHIPALLAHVRALEAEQDRLRLPIRAQATTETLMKQAVEAFRVRAIEAVRAHVNKYDDHYKHCLTGCIPELLQSLPATSEQGEITSE